MTNQLARTADATFQHDVEQSLRGTVLTRFEEACAYANAQGHQAALAALSDVHITQLQLSLHNSQGVSSTYRIFSDLVGQHIVLEQHYANGETHRQEITLAALNETVIDTELATFCSKAAGLRLAYLAERHPAGFW